MGWSIRSCRNLTLRGFTIDDDPLPFVQGRIAGFDALPACTDEQLAAIRKVWPRAPAGHGSSPSYPARQDWTRLISPATSPFWGTLGSLSGKCP
ncbi:MAG: hypothetical protein A3K19_23540 [Lentisphaerae bacterium RIFOXYB12_FULL_65_16]|nr:MAG: hypothetical protein A3K18_29265 [Lentisphaerae bacterium RIFOXYA12_64_32]OGV94072.1 MAG: hypothetical protein A3K19_23540 [Lentisphaerae bacterium RIFOXYB12_FULL_65_16]